jgi:hypothetical protein
VTAVVGEAAGGDRQRHWWLAVVAAALFFFFSLSSVFRSLFSFGFQCLPSSALSLLFSSPSYLFPFFIFSSVLPPMFL